RERQIEKRQQGINYNKYLKKPQIKNFSKLSQIEQMIELSKRNNYCANFYDINSKKSFQPDLDDPIESFNLFSDLTKNYELSLINKNKLRYEKIKNNKMLASVKEKEQKLINGDPEFLDVITSFVEDEMLGWIEKHKGIKNCAFPFDPARFLKDKHPDLYNKSLDNEDKKAEKIIKNNNLLFEYHNNNEVLKVNFVEAAKSLTLELLTQQHVVQNYRSGKSKNKTLNDYDQSLHYFLDVHFDKAFVKDMKRKDGTLGGRKIDVHCFAPKFDVKAGIKLRHSDKNMHNLMINFAQKAQFEVEKRHDYLLKTALGNDSVKLNSIKDDLSMLIGNKFDNAPSLILNNELDVDNIKTLELIQYLINQDYEFVSVPDKTLLTQLKELNNTDELKNAINDGKINKSELVDFAKFSLNNQSDIFITQYEKDLIKIINQKKHNFEIIKDLKEHNFKIDFFFKDENNKIVPRITFQDINLTVSKTALHKPTQIFLSKFEDRKNIESKIMTGHFKNKSPSLEDISKVIKAPFFDEDIKSLKELADHFKKHSIFLNIRLNKNDTNLYGLTFDVFNNDIKIPIKSSALFTQDEVQQMLNEVLKREYEIEDEEELERIKKQKLKEFLEYTKEINEKIDCYNFYYRDVALRNQSNFIALFYENNSYWNGKFKRAGNDFYDKYNNKRLSVIENPDSTTYKIYDNNPQAIKLAGELMLNSALDKFKKSGVKSCVSSKSQSLLDDLYFALYFKEHQSELITLQIEDSHGNKSDYVPTESVLLKISQEVNNKNIANYEKMYKKFDKPKKSNTFIFPATSQLNSIDKQEFRQARIKILNDAICHYNYEKTRNYTEKHLIEDRELILKDAEKRYPKDYKKIVKYLSKLDGLDKALNEIKNENKVSIKQEI
ncbi:TPA: hypothetical protein ACX6S1_003832, partial [Photobacterium damselae]